MTKTRRAQPHWWNKGLSWRALNWRLPVRSVNGSGVTGLVVHRDGQYGWSNRDWVSGAPAERDFHFGLDVIGWITDSGATLPLDNRIVCCSPLEGTTSFVGPDEHGHMAVVLRHSPDDVVRRRFSFIGDLEEVYVERGEQVPAGLPLGRPYVFRKNYRFFHFGIGYEIAGTEKRRRVYINPAFSIDGRLEIRERIPFPSNRST